MQGLEKYAALGRPNVAYLLIKVLQTEPPLLGSTTVYGFDVYEIRQDQRTPDNPTLQYCVGGNEDGTIAIAAHDLGLENLPNQVFTVPFAGIREELEDCGVEFVVAKKTG